MSLLFVSVISFPFSHASFNISNLPLTSIVRCSCIFFQYFQFAFTFCRVIFLLFLLLPIFLFFLSHYVPFLFSLFSFFFHLSYDTIFVFLAVFTFLFLSVIHCSCFFLLVFPIFLPSFLQFQSVFPLHTSPFSVSIFFPFTLPFILFCLCFISFVYVLSLTPVLFFSYF